MKKNKFLLLISLLFVSVITLISSCSKDFLEVKPPTSLLLEESLLTEADLLVATRGMYRGLRSVNLTTTNGAVTYQLYGRELVVFGDVMADVAYVSPQNSNRFINQNRYTPLTGEGLSIWTAAYTGILRANNIINANVPANANVNQYKGEALAVRALLHFELTRFFAKPYTENPDGIGVPLILTFDPNDPGVQPKRDTLRKIYTQIINDLNQAFTLMTQFTNSSIMNKWAARGLLAKVYLTMGDYTNAKAVALDVINNGGFSVVAAAAHTAYWASPTPRTDKVETLFEVSTDISNSSGTDALAYIYSQAGYGDLVMAKDLYALHAPNDVRLAYIFPKTRGGETAYTVEKYPNVTNTSEKDDIKVLRLSDVYLIAAEASYHTGNETDARTYLNYIATRRVPGFTGYTSTGANLLNDILTERRKELAFEGDRLHTLNRLKLPIVRSTDYPVDARLIPYPDYRRVLAIPLDEIQANPMVLPQNEGYN